MSRPGIYSSPRAPELSMTLDVRLAQLTLDLKVESVTDGSLCSQGSIIFSPFSGQEAKDMKLKL